jgi:hypothetical protein
MVTSVYTKAMTLAQRFHDVIGLTATDEALHLYDKELRVEELKELLDGFKDSDRKEQFDGLADADFINFIHFIMTKDRAYFDQWHNVNTSLAIIMGISISKRVRALEIVCKSNLSKFDTHEDSASKTRGKYLSIGVATNTTMDDIGMYHVTRSSEDQYCVNGKFYPKGKLVKSVINYFEPDFTELL